MANFEHIISKLNTEQVKPVLDTEGAVLVIAGAGSGKTRVLTSRIAYLILEKKVRPENILAITFTNKAAGEMKERLKQMVDADVNSMWVSTIHSMCVKILRSNIHLLGYDKNFTIYDETDKDRVLKHVLELLGLDADKYLKLAKNIISTAKNDCVSPEHFSKVYCDLRSVEEISRIYTEYENQLARSNSLDFDDLLCKTYELFFKHPEVAEYYAQKFEYVHIDEFQDTNKVQCLLAERLASYHQNIFVVGDDDQSIYGWRGAKIENIINFDRLYPNAKIYKLEQNYRSTKKILQLANCIIANNTARREKNLWTENEDGVKIEVHTANDENAEASYTAIQIKNLVSRGAKYKDIAVFMRLNALSRAYEQEFTKYAIPYRVFGGFRFFERKEIKDLVSYLKIVNNTRDDESFLRAVAFPKRGIGEKTLQEIREYAVSQNLSIFDAIDFASFTTLSSGAVKKLINFKNMLVGFMSYASNHTVVELIDYVIKTTGFNEAFSEKTEENVSRLYNISELENSAEEFAKQNDNNSLADYLNSITLATDTDSINNDDCITIATIHAVKGLEYDNVFVAGLDEKILPSIRAYEGEDEIEEERRLMYVAITRTKKRLYLTRALSRYMYGKRDYMQASRFLKEGGEVLGIITKPKLENASGSYYNRAFSSGYDEDSGFSQQSGGYSSSYAKTMLKDLAPKAQKSVEAGKYKSGAKVRHVKFGEGIVITAKGTPDNLMVDVAFKGVGIKTLSVKYAPMEII